MTIGTLIVSELVQLCSVVKTVCEDWHHAQSFHCPVTERCRSFIISFSVYKVSFIGFWLSDMYLGRHKLDIKSVEMLTNIE